MRVTFEQVGSAIQPEFDADSLHSSDITKKRIRSIIFSRNITKNWKILLDNKQKLSFNVFGITNKKQIEKMAFEKSIYNNKTDDFQESTKKEL